MVNIVERGASQKMLIPEDRRERNPLITEDGYTLLKSILEHPDAPGWNYVVGDRVQAADLDEVQQMRAAVRKNRTRGNGRPPLWLLEWVQRTQKHSRLFQRHIPAGADLEREWSYLPTMQRRDIVDQLDLMVPVDVDLERLIVYDTSGVTGHAIHVPHHPRTIAVNHALMEFVLEQYNISLDFSARTVACLNVGAQLNTVVFATVFSVWNQAGFVKVNLHPRVWSKEAARKFFKDLAPLFLTGDPLGFSEMLAWEIDVRPRAMLSTAVTLIPSLKEELERRYRCPVIDSYAATETGPIAYGSPDQRGLSILPPDVYVEIVDDSGFPMPEGELGEICVSGGRNPYLPLLRYRTGDFARLRWNDTPDDDPMPRLFDLQAREAVVFYADDGTIVSPVDVGRIIRQWAFVQHEFIQHRDRSCDAVFRPVPGISLDLERISKELQELFGAGIALRCSIDERLGDDRPGGKVVPFRSELKVHTAATNPL